jgi:hypothetical protein
VVDAAGNDQTLAVFRGSISLLETLANPIAQDSLNRAADCAGDQVWQSAHAVSALSALLKRYASAVEQNRIYEVSFLAGDCAATRTSLRETMLLFSESRQHNLSASDEANHFCSDDYSLVEFANIMYARHGSLTGRSLRPHSGP